MAKFIKLFFIFAIILILIVVVYHIIEGKFYESFAMLELYPERPAVSVKGSEGGYSYEYSQGFKSIPWPS
ncbi:MAG: hypothetical protein ACK4NF_05815, partial [Planctomycetota bacterium]